MRRVFLSAVLGLACAASAILPGQSLRAADEIAGDKLLPRETLLFFSLPDVPELKEQFNKSVLGQLMQDPAMQPFLTQVHDKLDEASDELEMRIGLTINDLWSLPRGQATFAVLSQGRTMSLVTILEYGDKDETLDTLLAKMDEAAKENGATESTQEINGTEVTVFQFMPPNEQPGPAQPRTVAYFAEDGALVLASDVSAIKAVLERWDGESGSTLADNEIYSAIMEQTSDEDADALIRWYLNPIGLVQAVIAQVQETMPQAQIALGVLPILGVDRLRGMGGTFELNSGEFNSVSRQFVYVDQPTSGVLNIFHFPAVEQSPPQWVPAGAAMFYAVNWDVAGAYRAVESLVDLFQGPGTLQKLLDSVAQRNRGAPIHLKTDLIDQMTGKIYIFADVPDEEQPETQRAAFALEVKDPARMKKSLAAAAQSENAHAKTRDFRGETIYEFNSESEDGPHIAAAVTQGMLMIVTEATLMEQILRSDRGTASLAQSPEYRAVASHFPKLTSMIGYQKQDVQIRTAYEALRSGETQTDVEGLDFTKLPPFKTIEKYMRPSGSYMEPAEHGARIVSFSLRKAAK